MESNILTAVFLPLGLAAIMFGMGLTLTLDDFRRVVLYPKAAAAGIFCQLALLPLIGFFIATALPMEAALAVGIMIIACAPGGPTSNLITHLAKGDVALSISLTAITSVVTVFTIPLIVNFSLIHFLGEGKTITLPFGKTVIQIFAVTILPTAIGMIVRSKKPSFASIIEPILQKASAAFLFIIIAAAILKERENLPSFFAQTGVATLLLNLSAMAVGYAVSRLLSLNRAQQTSLTVEVGIQNGTLAIAVGATLLGNPTMVIPPAIYSLIMFVTGGILIGMRRRSEALAPTTG
jgi:BASS family bile acid:Na+ symporter